MQSCWMQGGLRPYGGRPRDPVRRRSASTSSVWEFFWPFLAGARLVLARPGGHREPAELTGADPRPADHRPSTSSPRCSRVFLAWREVAECAQARRESASGEALPESAGAAWGGCRRRLHNVRPDRGGGRCDTLGMPAGDRCAPGPDRPSDRGTPGYVLDASAEPVPVGVAGELYLGGPGVARGYSNRPGPTAERFLRNPFGGRRDERHVPDRRPGRAAGPTALEYLGRLDDQVKIRGFRIELGEIKSGWRTRRSARRWCAARGQPGDKRPWPIWWPTGPAADDLGELQQPLAASLPEYMVRGRVSWTFSRSPPTASSTSRRCPRPGVRRAVVEPYASRRGMRRRRALARHLERSAGCRAGGHPRQLLPPRRPLPPGRQALRPDRGRLQPQDTALGPV